MSAHYSSFGITISPRERIIYRDANNEPTTKEHARFLVVQRFYDDGKLKEEIIEDLEPQQQRSTTGFMAMVEASHPSTPSTETAEPEEETHPNSEFTRMLEESSKGSARHEQTHTAIPNTAIMTGLLRQVDENQFPDLCNPMACPPNFARHCRANRPENYGKSCIYKTLKNR